MSQAKFEFGDSVRHRTRPEWGVGAVVKTEDIVANGVPSQRLDIRFPNAGLKTLNSLVADIEAVRSDSSNPVGADVGCIDDLDRMEKSEWLAPLAQKKIDEVMTCLPPETRDVFSGLSHQLESTLRLYRFDRSGRGLMDWAVAQTGLDDPLSRFNRHELEAFFDRWARGRDEQLQRLVHEARDHHGLADRLLADAPAGARQALQRVPVLR